MYSIQDLDKMRIAYQVMLNVIADTVLRSSIAEARVQTAIMAHIEVDQVERQCEDYCIQVLNLVYNGLKAVKEDDDNAVREWSAVNGWLMDRITEFERDEHHKDKPVVAIKIRRTNKRGLTDVHRVEVALWKIPQQTS